MSRFPVQDPWADFPDATPPTGAVVRPTAKVVPPTATDPWADFPDATPAGGVPDMLQTDVMAPNTGDNEVPAAIEEPNKPFSQHVSEGVVQFGSAMPRTLVRAARGVVPNLPGVSGMGSLAGTDAPKAIHDYLDLVGQRMDEYYGKPETLTGEFGGVVGNLPLAAAGPAGMAGIFGAAGAGGVYEDVAARRREGQQISPQQEENAAGLTGVIEGASGYIGGKLFGSIGQKLVKMPGFREFATKEGAVGVVQLLKQIAPEMIAEGGEEAATQFADNLVKQQSYAPEQQLGEGVAKAGVMGAIAAPIGGGVAHLQEGGVSGRPGRVSEEIPPQAETPPPAPPAEVPPQAEPVAANAPPVINPKPSEAPPQRMAMSVKNGKVEYKPIIQVKAEAAPAKVERVSKANIVDQIPADQQDKFALQNDIEGVKGDFVRVDIPAFEFGAIPKENLDLAKIKAFAARKQAMEQPPAIIGIPDAKGNMQIKDGRHRLLAAALQAKARGEDPNAVRVSAVVPESWAKEKGLLPAETSAGTGRTPTLRIRQEAADYTKQAGIKTAPVEDYAPVDVERAKQIASAYDLATHSPNEPAVKKAYDAFKKETKAQWDFLQGRGIKMEPWKGEGQPYKNSAEMVADASKNKHLYFFQGGEIPADHPLAEKVPGSDLTYNDVFRAVHDYFGHAKEGNQFGPRGEENAWRAHSMMYGEEARKAMTTETRGQNSWVNFGPKGEANQANPEKTTYAEQKATLLPDQFVAQGSGQTGSNAPTRGGNQGGIVPPGATPPGGTVPPVPPGGVPPTPPSGPTPPGGPSNPVNLPASVAAQATATPPVRQRTGIGALLRAFESSHANRPTSYVQARERLAGGKNLARMDVVRGGIQPFDATMKKLGMNPDDRAVQFQITEVLRGHRSPDTLPAELRPWVAEQRKNIDALETNIEQEARQLGMDDFADSVKDRMGTYLAVAPIKRAGPTLPATSSRERLNPEVGHFRRDRYVITDGSGKVVGDAQTLQDAQAKMQQHVATHTGKAAQLTLHDPIPQAWRMANEIHDPRHLVGRTMVEGVHLQNMLRLINESMPYARTPPKGLTADQEAEWAKRQGFGQVVADRRLGPLGSKYLPIRMAEDFNEAVHVPSEMARLWHTFNSAWKVSKTAFNLPTSGHNVASNALVFAYLDGISPLNPMNWKYYKDATKSAFTKTDPVWRKAAEANFVGGGGRYAGELQGILADAADFDTYLRNSLLRTAKKSVQGVQEFYGAQDDIFKIAAIKKRMAEGQPFDQALAETREMWPDNARASKIARWLSNAPLGSSFIRFTDQALRVAGRAAKKHPVRFATVAAMPLMLDALSRAWLGLKDDDKEAKLLDEGRSYAEPLTPWRDDKGRLQTFDMRYIIPLVNDILPEQRYGMLKVPVLGNTPLATALLEQGSGRDRFTGRTFVNDQMGLGENLKARGKQLTKTLAPVPSSLTYGVSDISQAAKGESDRVLGNAILNQLTGINIRTPYIAEKVVRNVAQNMLGEQDRDEARALLKLWNDTYKPGNQTDIKMTDLVRGMRASHKRTKHGARDKAAEALMRGDTDEANKIIGEYNAERPSRLTELGLPEAERQVEIFKRKGRER